MSKPVSSDKESQKNLQDAIAKHAKRGVPAVLRYLLKVVKGKETEERMSPTGVVKTVKVPSSVRVSAAKVYQGYVNKLVADKKDDPKQREQDFNPTQAIKDVAKSKEEEKRKKMAAAGGGNIVEFPHGGASS